MATASATYEDVGPFHTHGELGALFAAGIAILVSAIVITVGVVAYSGTYSVNCQSERGTALMIGTLWSGGAGCVAASAFRTVATSVIVGAIVMLVAFTAGQWIVHAAFLPACPPHPHWFELFR